MLEYKGFISVCVCVCVSVGLVAVVRAFQIEGKRLLMPETNSADSDNVGLNDVFPRTSIVMSCIGFVQQTVVKVNFVQTICHQLP